VDAKVSSKKPSLLEELDSISSSRQSLRRQQAAAEVDEQDYPGFSEPASSSARQWQREEAAQRADDESPQKKRQAPNEDSFMNPYGAEMTAQRAPPSEIYPETAANARPSDPVYRNEFERIQEAELSYPGSASELTPQASEPMRESSSNARPDSNPGTSGRDSSARSSEVEGLRAQVARQAARIRKHEQDHKAL
jgi:hypothetical protein